MSPTRTDPRISSLIESALSAAETWAFERSSPEQKTVSLLVLHKGEIVLERYADGFDMTTRTRTWSTAKSIAASTLIGMKVDNVVPSHDLGGTGSGCAFSVRVAAGN